jgi:CubicO group peptidase (beta-lactamase class C family)
MSGREEEMDERERGLAAALDQIRGVDIDEAAVRAHVMRPGNLLGVSSDRGREGVPAEDVALPGPGPGPLPVPGPGPVVYGLDAAGFIQELEGLLTGNVAGFSIRLTENGSTIGLAGQNWAKEPQDGSEAWTPDIRMHVASLSKIVTAAAMTRLLGEAGISPYTLIIDHLPAYWVKGPNVNSITFAELLTHTSGLAFGATNSRSDFEWMKEQIAAGTTHLGQFSYQNMNFGLCRILLATINGNVPVNWLLLESQGGLLFPEWVDNSWDSTTIGAYASYVARQVFAPAGVTGPDFTHDAADALAYNFPVTGNGWDSGDLTTMAGGAGWHMSVDELLQVMATFRRGGTIVSTAQAQVMLDDGFGIDYSVATPPGTYYAKLGGWNDNSGHQEQGVAFFLPLNMELVVLVNSPVFEGPINDWLYPFVKAAYLAHIVDEAPPVASASPA